MAAFVWLVGMLPSTFLAPETWVSCLILEPPYLATLALVQLFGLGFGGLLGLAQWIVLRRHTKGAWKWIPVNALGWSAGLPFLYFVAAVPVVETSLALNFVATVAVAAAGGLSMGAITGAFLLRLSPLRVEGGVMLCREVMKTDVARCPGDAERPGLRGDHARGQHRVPARGGRGEAGGRCHHRSRSRRPGARRRPAGGYASRAGHDPRDVRVCRPDDELQAAEWKMSSTRKSRLVVADDEGHCVGVISLSDVAQADSRHRAGAVLRAVTRREAPAYVVLRERGGSQVAAPGGHDHRRVDPGCGRARGTDLGGAAGGGGPLPESVAPSVIPNYSLLRPDLAAAGQPTEEGLRRLRDLGFRVVIDLRAPSDGTAAEEAAAGGGLALRVRADIAETFRREDVEAVARIIDERERGPACCTAPPATAWAACGRSCR